MRKTSTILTKCSSGIVAALAMLTYAFSSSAEEYKSMIRYDRVWEHVSIRHTLRDVYYTKFDGPEVINGKTYHRLVTFRTAAYSYKYDYNYDDYEAYVYNVDENYYEHEGFLREEDGKVYTLLSGVGYSDGACWGSLYIPSGDGTHPSDLEEKVIYDFTCKEGESYQGLHIERGFAEEMTFNVKSIETVEIDGEEHRLLRISIGEHEHMNEPIVEGVGIASDDGCLTTINFFEKLSCPCAHHMFNRVLSTDGRVVYRNEYNPAEIPVDDFLGTVGTAEITEQSATDTPLYDIFGRRITDPVPGQLYIQDGKKHIAR